MYYSDFKATALKTEKVVTLLACYIAGHWAMKDPKMAASGFSARKSNVREIIGSLLFILCSLLLRPLICRAIQFQYFLRETRWSSTCNR